MKRKLVFCLAALVGMQLAAHLHAFEFSNTISVGEVGITTTFSSIFLYAHLVNFTVQEENGFGIHLTPVRALIDLQTISFTAVTFVNAMAYYDFFNKKEEILLGPFASINTVNVLKIDSVEYNAGLLFSVRTLEYEFGKHTMASTDWLTVKAGYEYLDGDSNFYAQIGIDLLTVVRVIAFFQGPQNEGIIKDNNRRR
jgi:hypothetical protein